MLSETLNFRSRVGGAVLSLALCLLTPALRAQTPEENLWTGAVSNTWDEPANWSLGHVPTYAERARVTGGDVQAGTVECAELSLDAGTLRLAGYSHTSSATIAAGATLVLTADAGHVLGGTTTNHGTILWEGGMIMERYLGDRIVNESDGIIDIRCDELMGYAIVLENRGVLRKSAGAAATGAAINAQLVSSGSIVVASGTLTISEPAAFAGPVRVESGAALSISAGYSNSAPVQLRPTAHFDGQGTITLNGSYSGTFTGQATYQGGRATDFTITSGSTLTVAGLLALAGTFTNHGIVAIRSGGIWGDSPSSVLLNADDGIVDMCCDAQLSEFAFTNAGILRQSAGTTEGQSVIWAPLSSSGSIIVETGALEITEPTSFSGTVQVAAGARFTATASNVTTQITPPALFTGDGEIGLRGNFAGTFAGKASLQHRFRGDLTITPGSTLSLEAPFDSDFTLGGTLTNHGTILWTSGNINLDSGLPITGTIINESDGVFDIRGSAHLGPNLTFDNRGTILKAAANGTIGTTSTCTLTSTGRIVIEAGGIELTGPVNYAGLVHVDAGARLGSSGWSNPINVTPSAHFEGDGMITFVGNVSGTLSGNAALVQELTGDLTIASGSHIAIGRSSITPFRLNGTLTNHGTLHWVENSYSGLPATDMGRNNIAGTTAGDPASRIINETDGVFDLECGGTLESTVALDNHGTIRKTGSLQPFPGSCIAGAFTNDGTIEISVGLLTIASPQSNAGRISVAAGATLQYAGSGTGTPLLAGSVFEGAGTIRLMGNISGTLVGHALLAPELSGDLTIAAGSTVTIGDSDNRDFTLSSSLTNHGTVLWYGGRILGDPFFHKSTIVNAAGGVFDIRCHDTINVSVAFINQGTVRKTADASTTTFDCSLANSGTIEIGAGELALGPYFTQSQGSLRLTGGTLSKAAFDLVLNGGELSGFGTVRCNLVAKGAIIRPGTADGAPLVFTQGLRIMPGGTLVIDHPEVALLAAFLKVDDGAALTVQIDAAPSSPLVQVSGSALLGGTLNLGLGGGFVPALRERLPLITGASSTGTFATSSFPSRPAGAIYSVAYGANLVEVVVGASTYADWKALHFGGETDPAITGDHADPDSDGVVNLLEYAFGLEPLAASRAGLPVVALQPATAGGPLFLTLTYTTPDTVADLAFVPEVSGNLADWQSGPGHTETVSDTTTEGIRTVVVRDTVPVSTGARRFIRLSVQVPALQ